MPAVLRINNVRKKWDRLLLLLFLSFEKNKFPTPTAAVQNNCVRTTKKKPYI